MTIKFYIASFLVFKDIKWNDEGFAELETGTYSESIPAFLPAESIAEASEMARAYLFERWKPEDGWHTHQANIMKMGKEQVDAIIVGADQGVIDVSAEEPQTYNFELP